MVTFRVYPKNPGEAPHPEILPQLQLQSPSAVGGHVGMGSGHLGAAFVRVLQRTRTGRVPACLSACLTVLYGTDHRIVKNKAQHLVSRLEMVGGGQWSHSRLKAAGQLKQWGGRTSLQPAGSSAVCATRAFN